MLLVLTKKVTNRVQYTFRLMLEELLGLKVSFTLQIEDFRKFEGPRLAYGIYPGEGDLYFAANDLLFENWISNQNLRCFPHGLSVALFPVFEKTSALPFDPFAAAFYLVSRYEEYLPHIRDIHGRFVSSSSEAMKYGFLKKPLVNIWANQLGDLLSHKFPALLLRKKKYSFFPTIDIDAAYAYKHKGLTRSLGGLLKSLRNKDYQAALERIRVLMNKAKDPFDTFDYLFRLQEKYQFRMIYFILMADYGPRDKNIPVNNRHFQQLIKLLADYAEVGIHPSYASYNNPSILEKEISRLSKILHQDITRSRQHFLRMEFPLTYRNLINQEITDDYTMGYADEPGFRASICTPFNFYDLDQDMETHLRIHPFTVMDGTLNDYLRLTPVQAIEVIRSLVREVREVNGTFIPLWHNQTLNDRDEWKGWLKVFEVMLEIARE